MSEIGMLQTESLRDVAQMSMEANTTETWELVIEEAGMAAMCMVIGTQAELQTGIKMQSVLQMQSGVLLTI